MYAHARHIKIIQLLKGASSPETCRTISLHLFDLETRIVPLRSVQRDMNLLVKSGLIVRHGSARATKYYLSDGTYRELVKLSIAHDREREEFKKYEFYGIAPRFRFPNMDKALSWIIRRTLIHMK